MGLIAILHVRCKERMSARMKSKRMEKTEEQIRCEHNYGCATLSFPLHISLNTPLLVLSTYIYLWLKFIQYVFLLCGVFLEICTERAAHCMYQ